ncbi:IS3 family transposase [Slackia isoflavoniconvertens]|uniref:IS3 family transposase n=1 Tax=Slackia isoflavoniconvertens TaxID=572010 RepID=UPI003AB985EF
MYGIDEKRRAIETLIRFDHSYADTIAELGYPNRHSLYNWWNEYKEFGEARQSKHKREPRYGLDMRRAAVDYCLGHGKSLARTMRAMGYPSKEVLTAWIDELAPGQRKALPRRSNTKQPLEKKIQAVAELEARRCSAGEVAARHGVSRTVPYQRRRDMLAGDNDTHDADGNCERIPVSNKYDELPDDAEELRQMAEDLRLKVRKLQLELDVREATLEIVKKDPGTDPNRLTNREKALLIDSLRGKYRLREPLEATGIAKSSCEYASNAPNRPESEKMARIREDVAAASDDSGNTYGYRRICAVTGIAERGVRKVMREEGLVAASRERRRRCDSYAGEISEAPENTCLNEDGTHDFGASAPNELWITDITEFGIKAGKAYLSPMLDRFDGMPLSWSISTSPNADLANSSLEGACEQLAEGEHPRVHNDRGCHYQWPGGS